MNHQSLGPKPLVIFGDQQSAEVAYEYFTHDSPYEVVAFTVEKAYLRRTSMLGCPVVPFESLSEQFDPANTWFHAALVYNQLNRVRERMVQAAKAQGFALASYISSRAVVWPNAKIGEHCYILEHNTVQPFVTIGDNVTLWSGNHIGHHATIGNHVFVASHVVIAGSAVIGDRCFLGVNATVADQVQVGPDCVIGAHAFVSKNVEEDLVVAATADLGRGSARRLHRVKSSQVVGPPAPGGLDASL